MANNDKLKLNRREIMFFIIPFIVLSLFVGAMGYIAISTRIEDINEVAINTTVNIADSYALLMNNANEASKAVDNLMEEKLMLAAEAILLLNEEEISNEELIDIAEKLKVWRINLYNTEGEVIASNAEGNVGWKSYEGHPVQDFLEGSHKTHIEEIREGTINKDYSKFGYIRRDNGSFVQVGIVEEDLKSLTKDFQAAALVDLIKEKEDIIHILLVDMDYRVIASSTEVEVGTAIDPQGVGKYLDEETVGAERHTINKREALHTYAPMYSGNEKTGILSITWDISSIDSIVKETLLNSIIELTITIIIIGTILYYAYTKNKSNIKIAYYDKLTGLPNKDYLQEYIEQFTQEIGRVKKAVFFINLTNFKLINMTYGYSYGDKILMQVSNQIKESLSTKNVLFRFNADRFILLIEDYRNKDELVSMAEDIIKNSKRPLDLNHRLEYLNLEIAIVEINERDTSLDLLSKNLAFALNNNKSLNNEIIFYDRKMEEESIRSNKIEILIENILEGIDMDSFYLEYQPKLDIKSNKIVGFESLARLNHKELGFISPLEFVELAEKRMLIYDLGLKIFRQACVFLKSLENFGHERLNISVNVSVIQILRDEFVDDIKAASKYLEVDMNKIEFEITESVLIDNFELINQRLKEIKKLGIKVSIDDFGTGFSSFSRLTNLNIDILKIDKYFIDSILLKDEESLISKDIISMAHRLGLKVVAEGVEEESQRKYLEKYGCDMIQGYLISKPLSEEKALELLETYNKAYS